MADQPASSNMRRRLIVIVVVVIAIGGGVALWLWLTAAHESTDDAQVDGHIVQVSARVAGTVQRVPVKDNQQIAAGDILVELDSRDYQVAVDRARAELADAQAAAIAAQSNVPI